MNIGLVGCGRWGRFILRDLISLGCTVTVVVRGDESRQRALSTGARDVVASVAQLPSISGAIVATPTSTHAEIIEELLDRDIPIFTEKPLCNDARSASRLAEHAAGRLFVMDKWRYHSGIEKLASIARSEELGPVLGLRTTRVQWGCPQRDVDAVWTLLPHDLSIALEVFGYLPEPRFAVSEQIDGEMRALTGFLGDHNRPWFVCEISTRYLQTRREIRLQCRDGVAILNEAYSDHVDVTRWTDPHETSPSIESRPISTELPLLRELHAFVEHLKGGPAPRSSAG